MPTYVYRREDGSTFEVEQSIKDEALTTCPTTGQAVVRVIAGGTGLIFKGSGFYLTDYARKPVDAKDARDAKKADGSGATGAESKTTAEPAKPDKPTPAAD